MWGFGIDNYKAGLTYFDMVGASPTDARDGFIVYGENRSPVENTEWHVNVWCATGS